MTTMLVRERPSLRQHTLLTTPSGKRYRWAEDEHDPASVPSDVRHSDTIPGGFETFDATLPRKLGFDYSDLERLSHVVVTDAGGEEAWSGRLERAPRVSGDQMAISPSAVGYQAHLEDDKSARMIYVDRDISHWGDMALDRKLAHATAGRDMGKLSVSIGDGISWALPNESIPDESINEVLYDAGAGALAAMVGYRGARTGAFTGFEAPLLVSANSTDLATDNQTNALTLDDSTRTATLTAARRYLALRVYLSAGPVTPAAGHLQRYDQVAIYGDHGLTLQAIDDEPSGVYASDVVTDAVGRWAPLLTVVDDSVQASTFPVPHLAFLESTTAAEIIRQASRFGLEDWAVWEGRVFYWHARGARGRRWRARVAPAQLEETGPQVDRLWESVIVQYQDVDGTTRTVGPVGSGADTETAELKDDDPENPANKLGIVRRDLLVMGVSTAAGATEIGRRFLEESKLLDSSGRARLVGYVEDDRGVVHPYSRVRAGDTISFVDAADTSYRRIVRADKSRSDRTCVVDIDSPPEGLQALLERLAVALIPLGL